jgi:hypothetical protein
MARRRLKPLLEPPSSLVVFDPTEWDFQRWKSARHEWVKKHGPETSLGSMVDVSREERAIWEARNGYVA